MKRTIALVLALVLCLALFAGCGSKQEAASGSEEPAATGDKPLVVGYSNFSSKFSPPANSPRSSPRPLMTRTSGL